jgi:hypothetical protein
MYTMYDVMSHITVKLQGWIRCSQIARLLKIM